MLLRTDPKLIKGVCEFYPESKEERDLVIKLDNCLNKESPMESQLEFENDSESMLLIIYKKDEDIPKIRPPIGLRPRCIYNEERIEEIKDAMKRYIDAGIEAPKEWWDELMDLLDVQNKRLLNKDK